MCNVINKCITCIFITIFTVGKLINVIYEEYSCCIILMMLSIGNYLPSLFSFVAYTYIVNQEISDRTIN